MKNKIFVICQRDVKDCGPCCLKSIVEYYGGYVSLEKIRKDAFTSSNGTTVYHLVKAAENYGFDAVAKKILDKDISEIILPTIVHIKYENGLNHFMTLYKIGKKHVVLMDPSKGKITMNLEDFNKIFTGVIIELYPKRQILLMPKETSIYNLFLRILKNNKIVFKKLLLCSFLLTIFTIILSLYFKVLYNNISLYNLNKFIICLFFVILILKVYTAYVKNYYEIHINKNIDTHVFSEFLNHIFKLPLKVINTKSSGEIISRVSELSSIKDLFSQMFISSFLNLILSIGALVCLLFICSKLAIILVVFMILYILIYVSVNPYLFRRINQNIDYQTKANSKILENINMLCSIKNLNKENLASEEVEKSISQLIYDNFDFLNKNNVINIFKDFIFESAIFIINTYGFYLIFQNKLSLINLVTFNTILYYFTDPIKNLIVLLPKYNFFRASFHKVCEFIDIEEEKIVENEKFVTGDIEFKNVNYSYNNYVSILNNFNLKIENGSKILIKGPSGCGKSTICGMLLQNNIPSSGEILINNKNILDYNVHTLRNNITYVGQKENLYTDTIKNNILMYEKNNDLFDKVCDICEISSIVSKKAFRYNFGIDNNSMNISGGEKQRIILARALLKNSSILILDEALSETDYTLERKIIKNIVHGFPNKTLIYITHKNQDDLFKNRILLKEKANEQI